MRRRLTTTIAFAAALALSTTSVAAAQGGGADSASPEDEADAAIGYTIVPPDQELDGRSYLDLVKAHLDWFFWGATPATHPGAQGDCMLRQPGGNVFFLPHAMHGNLAEFDCTIRSDQHILAWFGGPICFEDIENGETFEDAHLFCKGAIGWVNPRLTIDGQTTPISGSFWQLTESIDIDFGEGNFFGFPPGDRAVAGAGWWALIEPLPAGEHTVMTANDLYERGFGFRERGNDQCALSICTARALMHVTVVDADSTT